MPPKAPITEPYPGPRPFKPDEYSLFFGRDEEIADLHDLVMSYQVVVLYSQSGAGKSSLIHAGLRPTLLREGVRILYARVSGDVSPRCDDPKVNIYLRNALAKLRGGKADLNRSLSENIAARLYREDIHDHGPAVIIFDQFEEIFTAYPDRWKDREGFFIAIRDALKPDCLNGENRESKLRFLFVLREEHLAELDGYSDLIPLNFRIRYRLERLKEDAALEAIQRPAQAFNFSVPDEDAKKLLTNLRQIKVRSAGSIREAEGEYIEPVQLQVVCRDMWKKRDEQSRSLSAPASVVDIDATLASYYDRVIRDAARAARLRESKIRGWVERELITQRGTRGLVYKGERFTAGLPNSAVALLEQEHVVRSEPRGIDSWYELTHDRLIAPITSSNITWRRRRRRRTWPVYFAVLFFAGLGAYAFAHQHIKNNARLQKERDNAVTLKERESLLKQAADLVVEGDGEASRGRWKEALASYNDSLRCYKKAGATESGHLELYRGMGKAYMGVFDYPNAEAAFEKAIRDSGNDPGPSLLVSLGQTLFKEGRTSDAMQKYNQALNRVTRTHKKDQPYAPAAQDDENMSDEEEAQVVQIWNLKAELQLRRADFRGSRDSYEQAIKHVTRFEQWGEFFETIFGIGLIESQRGEYVQGLKSYHILEGAKIVDAMHLPPRLWREIGFNQLHLGQYPEARKALEQARKQAIREKDVEQQASAALTLAEYHLEKAESRVMAGSLARYRAYASAKAPPIDGEELRQSLACAQDAAEKFKSIGDEVMYGATFTYQARVHIDRAWFDKAEGRPDSAKKEFDEALKDLERAYDSQKSSERRIGEAYALQAKGMLYEARNETQDAIVQYQKAYCIYTEIGSQSNHMNEVRRSLLELKPGTVPVGCKRIHFDSPAPDTGAVAAAVPPAKP